MDAEPAALPDDAGALKAALLAARADVAAARAEQSSNQALIAHLKLQIAKPNRGRFGPRSERTVRLLDRMELQLEELEAAATEDELAAEAAAARTTTVAGFMAAERLHGDDTTVPVLARGKTDIARLWAYVRDDRPFGGPASPGAVFHYSRDRGGKHPRSHLAGYSGIPQADAYGGYGKLYEPGRTPGPIGEAACWAHARRKFLVLADVAGSARRAAQGKAPAVLSPICLEAVQRIDALFDIERDINGHPAETRRATRQTVSAPLATDLHQWLGEQRARLARGNDVVRAIDCLLKRWPAFTRFLDDGRICLSNNAAERAVRGIALGRRSWLFCGSDRGGQRAAVMYSLIVTARLNDVDPQAWLADVLARIADHPAQHLDDLLPWHWANSTATPISQAA